ncbi:MAG: alpha/beta fold hydrolase [Chloroflexi bacterium]|nr:alpha/beta fold hydrolase [Chloroflexota bacterium]
MLWDDPSRHHVPLPAPDLPQPLLEAMLHSQEAAMRYGWKPFMHNPKLRQRLHRIACPTLVVWGARDRVVSVDYGKAFAASVPGARFVSIENTGHYPFREQLDAFLPPVVQFLDE